MKIPDLVAAVTAVKQKKIQRFASDVNRASGIGYAVPELDGCTRRGVYDRTHWKEKELHDVRGQFIFDEGHTQEQQVLRDLSDAQVQVVQQSQTFEIKDGRPGREGQILMRGSIDGKVVLEETAGHPSKVITLEIKSMNPMIFNGMNEFEDFRKKPWTLAYMAQIMAYMLGEGEEEGLFILKDKSNGTLKQIHVPLDYQLAEAVLRTAEEINDHVSNNTLPDRRDDVDKCRMCSHKKYCLPNVEWDVGPAVADDPSFERLLDEYYLPVNTEDLSLDDLKKKGEKLYKDKIAPKMKVSAKQFGGTLNLSLGKYRLSGKTDARGTFRPKIRFESEAEQESED